MDVQGSKPEHRIKLERVGIENLRYPVRILRRGKERTLVLTVRAAVDLPESQKGAHMSRFIEELTIPKEEESIEDLAQSIAKNLLKRHPYATRVEVTLEGEAVMGADKVYNLIGKYSTDAGKWVGIRTWGATACPCAIETTGGLSHNQRAILEIDIKAERAIEAEDLVRIADSSFSAPVKPLLKRKEEGEIVKQMHKNPKFVEDVVRSCVHGLSLKYKGMDCSVRCVSFESVHPHNVFAEWCGVL